MSKCVVSICMLLLVGCATIKETKQQDSFDMATNAYKKSILLGKYELANGLRKAPQYDQKPFDYGRLKKIKVTSYELLSVKVSQDKLLVNQTVEIRYYNIDYMLEKTLIDNQLWKYDTGENTWYIHSDFPGFQ